VLTTTDDEPKLVGEEIDIVEENLWKDAMVEDMEYLHNNET
jgi:hypothetical protein